MGDGMEFLLLWIDELDDTIGALRHLAPKIMGFLIAIALFVATGFALIWAPQVTLAIIGLVLSASLVEAFRRRRARATVD
jgi:membrane protein implicated in regulation of membrane protease activity